MEGNFELNTIGWYTVQNAEENEYLNNLLETDQYGIYYSVKFKGDAETYLWMAKSAPEEDKKYWGHLEKAKSGKSIKFKRDKEQDAQTSLPVKESKMDYEPGTNARWSIGMAYRAYVSVTGSPPEDDNSMWSAIEDNARRLVGMFERLKTGSSSAEIIQEEPKASIHGKLEKGFSKPKTLTSDEANELIGGIEEEQDG